MESTPDRNTFHASIQLLKFLSPACFSSTIKTSDAYSKKEGKIKKIHARAELQKDKIKLLLESYLITETADLTLCVSFNENSTVFFFRLVMRFSLNFFVTIFD